MIDSFQGDYFFLSNFYEHPFDYGGVFWPTAEHSFQAMKVPSEDPEWEDYIWLFLEAQTPTIAKKLGRSVPLRSDWEGVKETVMKDILLSKFADEDLKRLLVSTGDQKLVEGNTWGDKYWGQVDGVGENRLGELLMEVRYHYQIPY
jgi:ribA/ribD-fused uncharacterized protein